MSEAGRKSSGRMWAGIGLAVLLAAGAVWTWMTFVQTYHYAVVTDGVLYRSGIRSERELKTSRRKSNFKTVVSLVTDEERKLEEFKDEEEFCRDHGIEVIHVPVNIGCEPKIADVDRFLAVVRDKSKWPVLVHCAQGVQRTGMMVAAYQQRVLGYNKQQAMDAILGFNKGEERAAAVRAFIEKWYASCDAGATPQATAAATSAAGG